MKWEQIERSTNEEILDWAESQPWAQTMAACAQDAQWHAEGDVWTHTQMVCQELQQLDDWQDLSRHDQIILTFVALFHDSAKPLTTVIDPETGRVRSPKHAVRGEHIARNVLRHMQCDLATREQIAKLVRFHGRPTFLAERPEPSHEVVRMSWLLRNQLLYMFAIADTRGRTTESTSRPEENLQYWKLLSEELDCYRDRYQFTTDHARYVFFNSTQPNLHYTPHEEFSCRVTMMSGLPGSGKDTWLAKNRSDMPVVALDELRRQMKVEPTEDQGAVIQNAKQRCRQLLRNKQSFSFNATNLLNTTRRQWLTLFSDYGAQIDIVYLEPPLERILKQNKQRSAQVPEAVIRKLAKKLEPPTWDEAHQIWYLEEEGN